MRTQIGGGGFATVAPGGSLSTRLLTAVRIRTAADVIVSTRADERSFSAAARGEHLASYGETSP